MRYEKKMLILSGEGKGVVLIERSALGVRFAVRTFSLPARSGLMAGVITRSDVFVRELPSTADPSAVFYLDDVDLSSLHFAVFDDRLRLYGAFGKKMWESNVMGLLAKRIAPRATVPTLPTLPPITQKPKDLPMPDGSGIPQSRLAIYGDDALADSDFYTKIDFSSRMPTVDKFLDSPRILDGLSPTVTRPELKSPSVPQSDVYAPALEDDGSSSDEADFCGADDNGISDGVERPEADKEVAANNGAQPEKAVEADSDDSAENDCASETVADDKTEAADKEETVADVDIDAVKEVASVSAIAEEGEIAMDLPWESEARFLKAMAGNGAPVVRDASVEPVKTVEVVEHIRETGFLERCRTDIDKLFSIAERDGELNKLLPDIEWVRVEFDGHFVAVGRSKVFLCYAIAGKYEKISPLGDEAQWLPAAANLPTGKGYWLIFQDLVTGEIIRTA